MPQLPALRRPRPGVTAGLILAVLAACSSQGARPSARVGTPPSASVAAPSSSPTAWPTGSPQPLPDHAETTPNPSPTTVLPAPTAVPSVPVAFAGTPLLTDLRNPPVLYRVPTRRRVVFLSIDDGWTRDPGLLVMVRRARVPISTFLIGRALAEAPSYWSALSALGVRAEDHTLTHARLTTLLAAQQQTEICGDANEIALTLGARPTLLRPPYGSWNPGTVSAAARCGLAAVVLWDVSVVHGRLHYAEGSTLRPGDVLLLHFTPWIRIDFAAALRAVQQAGFAVGSLEDFIRPGPTPRPVRTPSPPRPSVSPRPAPAPSGPSAVPTSPGATPSPTSTSSPTIPTASSPTV